MINTNTTKDTQQQHNIFSLEDVRIKTDMMATSEDQNIIDLSELNSKKTIILWNSNLNERIEVVSFTINSPHVEVLDSEGKLVENIQVSIIWPNVDGVSPDNSVFQDTQIRGTQDLKFAFNYKLEKFELLFEVKLAPLSLTKFVIRRKKSNDLLVNRAENFPDVKFYHGGHNAEQVDSIKQNILKG